MPLFMLYVSLLVVALVHLVFVARLTCHLWSVGASLHTTHIILPLAFLKPVPNESLACPRLAKKVVALQRHEK